MGDAVIIDLSPASWLALRALVQEALAEPSDATPLLQRTLDELTQAARDFPAPSAQKDAPDTKWNN